MDDLLEIYNKVESFDQRLESMSQDFIQKLRCCLWGAAAANTTAPSVPPTEPCASAPNTAHQQQQQQLQLPLPSPSPMQNKKRVKRLSSLQEDEELSKTNTTSADNDASVQRFSTRASNSKLLEAASAMHVEEEEETLEKETKTLPVSSASSKHKNGSEDEVQDATRQLMDVVDTEKQQHNQSQQQKQQLLMPPPPLPAPTAAPVAVSTSSSSSAASEHSFARPQRAAKLKSEKSLKEPKLNAKMRRPSNSDKTVVKLEHEHRPSQMHEALSVSSTSTSSKASIASSIQSQDSVIVVPGKAPSVVDVMSEEEENEPQPPAQPTTTNNTTAAVHHDETTKKGEESEKPIDEANNETRPLRIKIKREKISLNAEEQLLPSEHASDQSTIAGSALSASIATNVTSVSSTTNKKGASRKKKAAVVKPIKVERFSDIDTASPISSRTRKGSVGRCGQEKPAAATTTAPTRPASIYEDAVDNLEADNVATPPTSISQVPETVSAAVAAINETVTLSAAKAQDATVVLGGVPGDATFCTASNMTVAQSTFVMTDNNQNPNATVTVSQKASNSGIGGGECDATFNVQAATSAGKQQKTTKADLQHSLSSSRNSMETAKDTTSSPLAPALHDDSIITEDESFERPLAEVKTKALQKLPVPMAIPVEAKTSGIGKLAGSAKGYKLPMPTRTNELFNPLVQSPVKKKVQAFENAATAHAATDEQHTRTTRPKRTKENAAPTSTQSSLTTPVIGKLHHVPAPALGRFLTPTQASNIGTPNALITAHAKKGPNSASKAMAFPKSSSSSNICAASTATNLKTTNSTSSKTLSRENSVTDDFRKGLHQMAEERKKQREQKHLLAAQQREVKERERAERIAKLAKEREEKRVKKQQEAELKKREMEEINRKLRQQEEAAEAARQKAIAAAAAASTAAAASSKSKSAAVLLDQQERELLAKLKSGTATKGAKTSRMMPPPPKQQQVQTKYTFEMLHEDDSTDDEQKTSYKRPPPPTWSRTHVRGPAICMQQYAPASVIDSFFSVQPMTPDLKLIFPNIDPRHLKRNSSALWATPPTQY